MTDADVKLKAMFAADVPPAMDAYFRLAVFERMEKRQAALKLALVIGVGAAATMGTALLAPQLSQLLPPNVMLVAGGLFAAAAGVWGVLQMRRPI